MKWLVQAVILIVAGVFLALLGYWVVGAPERGALCDPAELASGEVCLETVLNEWKGDVVWVDARSEEEWKKQHAPGALFITENRVDEMLAQSEIMQEIGMAGVEGRRVVVYCGTDACGSSKMVAERIRQSGLHSEVYFLHGGWKVLAAVKW